MQSTRLYDLAKKEEWRDEDEEGDKEKEGGGGVVDDLRGADTK